MASQTQHGRHQRNNTALYAAAVYILAICGLTVTLIATSRFNSTIQHEAEIPNSSAIDSWAILSLAIADANRSQSALVEFTTDWIPVDPMRAELAKEGLTHTPIHTIRGRDVMPATRLEPLPRTFTEERMYLQGRFRIVKELRSDFPNWSKVYDSVKVSTDGMGDQTYRNLLPLLRSKEFDGSLLLIAIKPFDAEMPRECKFIGPLKKNDLKHVAALMDPLGEGTYDKMTDLRAQQLVQSSNPWVVWLGLVRLRDLDALSPEHFAWALRSRCAEDFEDIYWEWTTTTSTRPFLKSLPLLALSEGVTPQMQKKAMQKIIESYDDPKKLEHRNMKHYMNLADFQKAVRAYRPKAAADPQRQELVVYLDRILKLREPAQ